MKGNFEAEKIKGNVICNSLKCDKVGMKLYNKKVDCIGSLNTVVCANPHISERSDSLIC